MKRERYIQRQCECCGETFEASRYDAMFCSSKCRLSHWRARRREVDARRELLNHMAEYLKTFQDNETYQREVDGLMDWLGKNSLV